MSDQFAERFAAVRRRFTAKLEARIEEIESTVPLLAADGAMEALARAHRRAHDLCGIGPNMGCMAFTPIFYSWSRGAWGNPLILLESRGRWGRNVVPRF